MSKNLVIVESPAKAKTIEGYLGKDFIVKSSMGHVRDLPKKDQAIDMTKDFEPVYEVTEDKRDMVRELKKLAQKAEVVWLATDEDREGEAISWHLMEALEIPEQKTKRIVFHEITKKAILNAIDHPRRVDIDLVNAQQARRLLDRLVGFELSPVLWKKVKPSLSAGRVQSVAVRIIADREKEIDAFTATQYFNVRGIFNADGSTVKADLLRKLNQSTDAMAFVQLCQNATFTVANLETKPSKRTPAAPFTTSTLQQDASRKLGFSVSATMSLAQKLYEAGKITYMRTDSVNLSEFALGAAKDEITKSFGSQYAKTRQFQSKSKGAQEAHEAIRPTEMGVREAGNDERERKLYDLIWKRTMASQMADAELENTTATIAISTTPEQLVAKGQVIKFDGFLKLYIESTEEDGEEGDSAMLPPLHVGQLLERKEIIATQRYTQKPSRYSEASLVKKLEELGIGRPSTYAPTISTIQQRGYVEKKELEGQLRNFEVITLRGNDIVSEVKSERTGADKGKLFPTDIGVVVNDFLVNYFPTILDYSFTANVEEEFDIIAEGKMDWREMLRKFYQPFHQSVETTIESASRASGERELGIDPATGKPVIARIGRFGPIIQIGASDDEEKKFASLRPDQSISSISLEEGLKLFSFPKVLGEWSGKPIAVGLGRFGPYVKWDKTFASLRVKEGDDPHTIVLERAIQLVEDKINGINANLIKSFEERPEIQVIKGRFGPYIKADTENYKIPKGTAAETLTLADILEIMANSKPSGKSKSKKAPAKKAAVKKVAPKKAATKKSAAKKKP
ncbi:MAG: type topoisomerase [Bacteroidota bacterium]|jgi:DNA topoisomerase-1